ncbi:MAG: cytochrome c maturation protein CcmE [Rhodospirillaceae bacterium]|nr:cytochrome c maturation protein CcmE [Rhodospirillaceae bacterium]MBT3932017.1 cytochrome c maturation protein CcmE [Rhodospirillaceae bacterium]MBT4773059.1 cytochrome c maturation protein CcmE [Rhodospirillaceae bacterium]MBT5358792.1 cytochrome c maturation protein CcmE [Rhodospirillaceae bacterium]MBT5768517.1 cytochrome c maturation protein CcmE [Rhodospirillaceae bacterium]
MKRKHRRLLVVAVSLGLLGSAAALVLNAVEDSLVFFYTPSDLAERPAPPADLFRLGGLVEEGSVRTEGATTFFVVTDLNRTILASYTGVLPDLFREGQGVVAEGTIGADGRFTAREVLAKHDETYMPKEVADALRKSGQWREGEATQ